jgi:predicted peroxiredoxin/TusA-related sulfurtransferase
VLTPKPDRTLDCRGIIYPGPILESERILAEMSAGQILEVVTTDANTRPDLVTWASRVNAEVLVITDEVEGQYSFFVHKKAPQTEPLESQPVLEEEKLFLVVLTTGFDYTPIVRSAFMYASLAAAMGFDTIVYCVQAGADTMVGSKIDNLDQSKPGKPTIRQRFSEALDMDVRVEVCEQTANVRGIRAEDLLDGVVLKGGAVLIDYAARASGQLTF